MSTGWHFGQKPHAQNPRSRQFSDASSVLSNKCVPTCPVAHHTTCTRFLLPVTPRPVFSCSRQRRERGAHGDHSDIHTTHPDGLGMRPRGSLGLCVPCRQDPLGRRLSPFPPPGTKCVERLQDNQHGLCSLAARPHETQFGLDEKKEAAHNLPRLLDLNPTTLPPCA